MSVPSAPTAAPGSSKARLLIVSATYVTEENRKKLDALAPFFEVMCATCAEHTAYGIANRVDSEAPPANYRIAGLRAVGRPESTTKYWLRGLGGVFRRFPADVVLVESEPWAWIRWQAWFWKMLWRPRALFGEYSAENLERTGFKGLVLKGFYRAAIATADFVATCNRAGGEIYRRRGLAANRLLVSPQLGVDAALFRPLDRPGRDRLRRDIGVPEDAFLVGFCGRLVESKGVWDLLDAVRQVRAQRPGQRVHLVLLGFGPLDAVLKAQPGAGDFLHVLPPRPHAGVAPFMQTLDLCVLPSKPDEHGVDVWVEQFGYVLIQAMACGVPTLGSDSGAIPEVVNLPEMIFPPGNADALAAKIIGLLDDPARREAVAHRQRAQTLRLYANENLGTIWADFIRQFLPPRASNSR